MHSSNSEPAFCGLAVCYTFIQCVLAAVYIIYRNANVYLSRPKPVLGRNLMHLLDIAVGNSIVPWQNCVFCEGSQASSLLAFGVPDEQLTLL